jgi:hypothetical protein
MIFIFYQDKRIDELTKQVIRFKRIQEIVLNSAQSNNTTANNNSKNKNINELELDTSPEAVGISITQSKATLNNNNQDAINTQHSSNFANQAGTMLTSCSLASSLSSSSSSSSSIMACNNNAQNGNNVNNNNGSALTAPLATISELISYNSSSNSSNSYYCTSYQNTATTSVTTSTQQIIDQNLQKSESSKQNTSNEPINNPVKIVNSSANCTSNSKTLIMQEQINGSTLPSKDNKLIDSGKKQSKELLMLNRKIASSSFLNAPPPPPSTHLVQQHHQSLSNKTSSSKNLTSSHQPNGNSKGLRQFFGKFIRSSMVNINETSKQQNMHQQQNQHNFPNMNLSIFEAKRNAVELLTSNSNNNSHFKRGGLRSTANARLQNNISGLIASNMPLSDERNLNTFAFAKLSGEQVFDWLRKNGFDSYLTHNIDGSNFSNKCLKSGLNLLQASQYDLEKVTEINYLFAAALI